MEIRRNHLLLIRRHTSCAPKHKENIMVFENLVAFIMSLNMSYHEQFGHIYPCDPQRIV
jgi:hypothetical protein